MFLIRFSSFRQWYIVYFMLSLICLFFLFVCYEVVFESFFDIYEVCIFVLLYLVLVWE